MEEEGTQITDIFDVASGNKPFMLGFYTSDLLILAGLVFVAFFLALLLAGAINRRLA